MIIDYFHKSLVQEYRTKTLSRLITSLLQTGEKVIDIGCGDGQIDHLIQNN
jgi:ubiquinone/menaquinone biosynthesis C-methylase UbiE